MTRTEDARCEQIRQRVDAATPGPWKHDTDSDQRGMPFVYTEVLQAGAPLKVDIDIGTRS